VSVAFFVLALVDSVRSHGGSGAVHGLQLWGSRSRVRVRQWMPERPAGGRGAGLGACVRCLRQGLGAGTPSRAAAGICQ
jgi:hypothetical protein